MDSAFRRDAEWDCTQLVYRFYRYLDESRYDELANLFVEAGVWNRLGRDLVGAAAIREAMRERQTWITVHIVTNVQITLNDEHHAETFQYITLYRHEGWDSSKGPAPVVLPLGILRHRDQLVSDQGTWRFQRKTSRAIMTDRSRVTHYDKA